jgi:hypothetical protein
LASGLLGQNAVHEQRRRLHHPPGPAARTESAALAQECHELLGLAGVALDPQKGPIRRCCRPGARALVDLHIRLCDGEFARQAGTILFPRRFLPPERWDRTAMKQASDRIGKHLELVETALGDDEYLVGDTFTLADVAYLHFLPLMEVSPGPRASSWSARRLSRPSALATVPDV